LILGPGLYLITFMTESCVRCLQSMKLGHNQVDATLHYVDIAGLKGWYRLSIESCLLTLIAIV